MKTNLILTAAITLAGLCGFAYADVTPTAVDPFQMVDRSGTTTLNAVPMLSPEALQNTLPGQVPTFNTGSMLNKVLHRAESTEGSASTGTDSNETVIYGVVASYSGTGGSTGLSIVPLEEGKEFTRITTGSASALGSNVSSGTETDGMFYANTSVSRYGSLYCTYHYVYTTDTWQRVGYAQSTEFKLTGRDMATDPTTGKMYGIFMKTDASTAFVIAEYLVDSYGSTSITHSRRAICDLPRMFTALFFTKDGQMWGIDMVTETDEEGNEDTKSASLYKINKETGELTLVGETGAKPYYCSSAVCDIYNTGKVYWSVKTKDNTGSMYTVDTTTGAATKLFDFPHNEEVVAMYIKSQPMGSAPAAPENLCFNTTEGSLTGTIDFDVPNSTYDGTPATGEVNYTVTLSGSEYATGKAKYGEKVSVPFSASYTGVYTVSVQLSNESGKSPSTSLSDYIGAGKPAIPQNVTATYENGMITVTWDKVTGAVNDLGYINKSSIRYTIVRTSDNVTLESDLNTNKYIDANVTKEGLGYYRYSVYATAAGDVISGEGKSNAVTYGNIIPPFEDHFDDVYHIYESSGDQSYSLFKQKQVKGSATVHWYVHASTKAATIWPSSSVEEDSWLMSPGVYFEAGKTYTVSMYAWSTYTNKTKSNISMFLGKAQDVDAMTTELMEADGINVKVANKKYKYVDLTVPETGVYYIGIRCYSNKESNAFYLDDFTITEGAAHGRPASVSSLTATVTGTGSYDANIKFTAPSTSIEGATLEDNVDITLSRNDEEIKKWTSVAPGTEITYTDTCEEDGDMTYSVVCSNSVGSSDAVTATAHVGFYLPKTASAASLEDLGDGNVKVSWTAVLKDSKNKALTTDQIRFCVVGPDESGKTIIVKDDIAGSESSYTFNAYDATAGQGLLQFGVAQKTNAGYSDIKYTNLQPVGKAYEAPYDESFTGNSTHVLYAATTSGTIGWQLATNTDFTGVTAADNDNAYLAMYSVYYGGIGYVGTGIIDLTGIEHPGVSFMVYNINGGTSNANEITVSVSTGGEYAALNATAVPVYNLGYANGWCKYVAKLDQYAGQKVLVKISLTCKTYNYFFLDNLHIGEIPTTDLTVIGHSVTPEVEEHDSASYVVMYLNNGYNDAEFASNLQMNGKVVDTKTLKIASGESAIASFTHRPDVDAGTEVKYSTVAVAENESDATDNTSEEMTVSVLQPTYPVVNTLIAKSSDNVNHLSWEAPELTYVPNPRTETFESNNVAWTDSIDNWTLLDVDQLPISLGTANGVFPKVATGDTLGMFVWDVNDMSAQQQASIYYQAHSGTRYIGKAAPSDRAAFGDDWAISPELFGCAQTASLYARSETATSPENIEILYSTGSLDPKDFVSLLKVIDVPNLWTNYQVELPDGAKRLAIRAYSPGTFFLHVDDVKFIPTAEDLTITGYHVWRDGVRVTTEPVTSTSYEDAKGESDATSHTYRVSVVYNVGESCPSEEVTCDFSGVEGIAGNGDITITARQNSVVVTGAYGMDINVYMTDGRQAASVVGTDVTTVNLNSGVYVVKVGNKVAKVVVR